MNLFKKLFEKKSKTETKDAAGFWQWFLQHEWSFHVTTRKLERMHEDFLSLVMAQLKELNVDFACSAGMYDETTAELVITAEGEIKAFVFVEDLVAAAPSIAGWKFTALKPPTGLGISIGMNSYEFNDTEMSFFSCDDENYPDEVEITIVHNAYNEDNKNTIANGIFIYLDNALGELNTATLFDNILIAGPGADQPELIPLQKLNDFLVWKEKEFVEKYQGIRYNTDNDTYMLLDAEDEKGMPSIAVINQDLLEWDAKPSHPWMTVVELEFPSTRNGLPGDDTATKMEKFEEELVLQLPDSDGYLNLGRETHDSKRTIYLACKEFLSVSRILQQLGARHTGELTITYDIYKDKYWRTMERFRPN